jgi:hypothetical protein
MIAACAARSPASTAPSMYALQYVPVSVEAQWITPIDPLGAEFDRHSRYRLLREDASAHPVVCLQDQRGESCLEHLSSGDHA